MNNMLQNSNKQQVTEELSVLLKENNM